MTSNPYECGICYNEFATEGERVPLSLTCGHTICKNCWDNTVKEWNETPYYRAYDERPAIKCPFCRSDCVTLHRSVDPPKNIQLCAVIENRTENMWPQFNSMFDNVSMNNIQIMVQQSKDLSKEIDRKLQYSMKMSGRICKLEEEYHTHSMEVNVKLKEVFDRASEKRKAQLEQELGKLYTTHQYKIARVKEELVQYEIRKKELHVLNAEINKLTNELTNIKTDHTQRMWLERCDCIKFETSKQNFINDYYRIIPVIQQVQVFVNENKLSFNAGSNNMKYRYQLSKLLTTIMEWDINNYVTKVNPFIHAMDAASSAIGENKSNIPVDEDFRLASDPSDVSPKAFEIIYNNKFDESSDYDNDTELPIIRCILCNCAKTVPDKCACDMPPLRCSTRGCCYDSDEETQFDELYHHLQMKNYI